MTAFSSSFFKSDLADLTIFPDLNLRLAKHKPFTIVCISKCSRFCSNDSSLQRYEVRKLPNFVFHSFSMNLSQK